MSTFTPNLTLELPANSADVGTWDVPVNGDFTILDTAVGGNTTLNVVGQSGTIALTLAQYRNRLLIFSGALTANVNYQVPSAVGGFWYIINITSGAFTLTISSAGGGTSVVCGQGVNTIVLSDGANIRLGVTVPAVAAGATGDIQVNVGGVLAGFAGLTYDSGGGTVTSTNFSGNLVGTVASSSTVGASGAPVGYRNIPLSANTSPAATDVGKYLSLSAGFTVSAGIFNAGDVFVIINTGGSPITATQGTGATLFLAASASTGNRTIAVRGIANFLCIGGDSFLVSGVGVS